MAQWFPALREEAKVVCFTTRPDTLYGNHPTLLTQLTLQTLIILFILTLLTIHVPFITLMSLLILGVTYVVLAPEHAALTILAEAGIMEVY
jgi:hypothetical protein